MTSGCGLDKDELEPWTAASNPAGTLFGLLQICWKKRLPPTRLAQSKPDISEPLCEVKILVQSISRVGS